LRLCNGLMRRDLIVIYEWSAVRQSAIRHCVGAGSVAFAALIWGPAAAAAPGEKLCRVTRAWLEKHCDKAGRLATPERCTMWRGLLDDRCATDQPTMRNVDNNRTQGADKQPDRNKAPVLDKHVERSNEGDGRANGSETASSAARENERSKAVAVDANSYRKVKNSRTRQVARSVPPPHPKQAHKVGSHVVYVYVHRPRPCCYSEPLIYYRTTPYRDEVFFTDYALRPGGEAAFFRALEANQR
jgi:hypothetical protein